MHGVEDRHRPHGDEWRWRAGPPRTTPSITVFVNNGSRVADRRPRPPFGFGRDLYAEPIEPLLWEGAD
jgi:hypothetical protein